MRMEIPRSAEGGAMTTNARRTTNIRIPQGGKQKMKRNNIMFVIALIVAIAVAGNVQAAEPVAGFINSTTINDTHIVRIYLDDNPGVTLTTTTFDVPVPGHNDGYQFDDIDALLSAHSPPIAWMETYNATIEMRCADGSNVYRNTTPTTAHLMGINDGNTDTASLMEIEPCPTPTYPDLNVSEIDINPDCSKVGDELFANETNKVCATIWNNGTGDAVAFDVSFVIDGYFKKVPVAGLKAGNNTTVCITDYQPTAPGAVTINVTADCDNSVSPEVDEGNNSKVIQATVYNNGYKGKRWTGGEDLDTIQTHALKGNLTYSKGDSSYLSGSSNPSWTTYMVNWTAADLPIPAGATIEKARLYVYTCWDYTGDIPSYFSMSMNGNNVDTGKVVYADRKMFGTSDYPAQTVAYDVISAFNPGADNQAVLTNSYPDNVSLYGMLLVVVYADSSETEKLIWINEGSDILSADNRFCVVTDEAIAYAPFSGSINPSLIQDARLISIVTAGDTGSGNKQQDRLYFNGNQIGADVFNGGYSAISIDDRSVSTTLLQSSNEVSIQSYDGTEERGDYMEARNTFLVLEKRSEVVVSIDPCTATIGSDPSSRTTVDISLKGIAD
ncbi:MAG TPA: DUF3344 domain-containing protein, partial [Candidatus Methanoperedenaceae archaeon]|nr:DUF3344 domain-containing protein [Candidatus Methanoperedenaceae archaeon]